MEKAITIKHKMRLRKILHDGNFDCISIWKDGSWADTGTGYGGEQDGNNPIRSIARSRFYDATFRDITEKIREIENGAY